MMSEKQVRREYNTTVRLYRRAKAAGEDVTAIFHTAATYGEVLEMTLDDVMDDLVGAK